MPRDEGTLAEAMAEYNKERRLSGLPEMANPTVVMRDGQTPTIEDAPRAGAKVAPATTPGPRSRVPTQDEQDYAAELAGAKAEGIDTSAYEIGPTPSAQMTTNDGPRPIDTATTFSGGKVGTSVGKNTPTATSRFLYQNLSNNPLKGVRQLREDNPTLDFQYTPTSGPVYRDKLPTGQTESPEEWHPLDTYGNPILHPLDYLKKYGVVGGAKEVVSDISDEAVNLVSGAIQNSAAVGGGLAGGLPGAVAGSAISGGALNAAKQALGSGTKYGDLSGMELGITAAISAAIPAIFNSGASKAEIAAFTQNKIAQLKNGDKGAWDFVTQLLTSKTLPGPEAVVPRPLRQFNTQAGVILRRSGIKSTPERLAAEATKLQKADTSRKLGVALQPHLNTVTDIISNRQRGIPKRIWDAVTPQSSVSADVIRWAKEKVSPEYVKRMAEEAGVTINEKVGMTRRKLSEYLKDTDIGQSVYQVAKTAIEDIQDSLRSRYDTALKEVPTPQDWSEVRDRFYTAMEHLLDYKVINKAEVDLFRKASEFGDRTLILIDPLDPGDEVSQLGPAYKLFEHLNGLSAAVSDAKLSSPGVIGKLTRTLDEFLEGEKERLYAQMNDIDLKEDWRSFKSQKTGLEALYTRLFSDPVKSAATIEKALESGAKPAEIKRFIHTLDRWTHKIDLKNKREPRPSLTDYAKQTAVGGVLFPPYIPKTNSGAYAGGKALVQGPKAGAPGLIDKAYSELRGPKSLNRSLKAEESPIYQIPSKLKEAVGNAVGSIPGSPVNRWMLLDATKDKRHDKQIK